VNPFTLSPIVTMLEAWVVFPLVLAVLSLGLGQFVERITRTTLPGVLLVPVGSAALVAITSLAIILVPVPAVITGVVAGVAAFGLVQSGLRRFEVGATVAAAGVFLCYGAPVLASGTPTFAGYIKLDDTATFLALVDRAFDHGRSLAGLSPSSYEATLAVNLAHGYPLGSVLPLGIGHELVRTDVAWLYQPWLSWNAAMLALCLFRLASPLIRGDSGRTFVAFVAAQSALLYGFALWGGVKELVAAALVATAVAVAAELRSPYGIACLVPVAVVAAALVNAASLAAAVWLVPLIVVLVPIVRRRWSAGLVGLATASALAIPAFVAASAFFRGSNRATFTDGTELGNLAQPLKVVQIVGIWPSGDFRFDPPFTPITWLLLALAGAAGVLGVRLALRLRAPGLLLAVSGALLGAGVFVGFGAPWVGAKALAVGSPFVLLAITVGSIGLVTSRWLLFSRVRPLAVVALVVPLVLAGVVAWSNAVAYHDVALAPYSQLAELQWIGARFADDGPALINEYQPYGARHFLRRLDAEGVSELRRRPIVLRGGGTASKGQYVDIDRVRLPDLLVYRTLVLRKSPTESRPPAIYRLVWDGRWYRVWERGQRFPFVAHRPLGNALEPGGPVSCRVVRNLAAFGRLISFPRPVNLVWPLDGPPLPRGWSAAGGGAVVPRKSGTMSVGITLPNSARYRVWVGGSVRGRLTLAIDDRRVGTIARQLQNAGQWLELGIAELAGGAHQVRVDISLPTLTPGTGGGLFPLGPLLLEPLSSDRLLTPARPTAICGRNLDWIETRTFASG
jgi:hypothetical protein